MSANVLQKVPSVTASMRGTVKGVLACAGLLFTIGAATAQETVVFAGWGGSLQQAQRTAYFEPFEQETGIRVIDAVDLSYAKIKAMVDTGDVQWDVVNALGMWTPMGERDNLWEPLDYDVIERTGIPDEFVGPYTIGNGQYASVLGYNTEALGGGAAPETWADFWNVEEFPGRRAWRVYSRYQTEAALMAAGLPPYPLDVDAAFESLNLLKPNISVWPRNSEQVVQMLASGEVAMAMTTHTRIIDAQKEGIPVAFSWEQGVMTVDNLAVPRGAPNRDNAMLLINWMSQPENQARLADITAVGPTNERALEFVSEEMEQLLPTVHFQSGKLIRFDDAWWADNVAMMDEKYLVWSQDAQ